MAGQESKDVQYSSQSRMTQATYELNPNKLAPDELVLLGLGSHENFYAQLKR